jgi:hypothetical protein
MQKMYLKLKLDVFIESINLCLCDSVANAFSGIKGLQPILLALVLYAPSHLFIFVSVVCFAGYHESPPARLDRLNRLKAEDCNLQTSAFSLNTWSHYPN